MRFTNGSCFSYTKRNHKKFRIFNDYNFIGLPVIKFYVEWMLKSG